MYSLRIVSTDKILHFINTFIIVIFITYVINGESFVCFICFQCAFV